MRRFGVRVVVACSVLSLVALAYSHNGFARPRENTETAARKATAKKTTKKKKTAPKKARKTKKATGRLPSFYAQIGLSDEQREKIYEIQRTYREQFQELRKKLQALEAKQKEDIEEVLTDEQKSKLADLMAEAKKKRAAAAKKKKSGA